MDGSRLAGATGAVVLAESHLAVHTWPELRAVTLDLYVCNFSRDNSAAARAAFAQLIARFCPHRCVQREIVRGQTITVTLLNVIVFVPSKVLPYILMIFVLWITDYL